MIKINILMFLGILLTLPVNAEDLCKDKRIILNVDINKTIIASDLAQGKGLEDTTDEILADYTFAKWDGQKLLSYHDFVTDKIVSENPQLQRGSDEMKYKRQEELKKFPENLKQFYPELFITFQQEKADILRILGAEKLTIFPSFYKVIRWLDENCPNKYTLHMRTFGKDLPEIISALETNSNLRFAAEGKFEKEILTLKRRLPTFKEEVVTIAPTELAKFFYNEENNLAIQDDYQYWKSKNFKAEGGKLFPIDLSHQAVVAIFFDDNAGSKNRPIIHPIKPNGELEDTEKLIELGNIVRVNPKDAILDENYFINKIKAMLK